MWKRLIRMKTNNPFYKTVKWIKKRGKVLRRDNYECRECKRYGKTTPADTVHHIYPLEFYPLLRLVTINLLSLCNTCHNKMHDRKTNNITKLGIAWQRKIYIHVKDMVDGENSTPPLKSIKNPNL